MKKVLLTGATGFIGQHCLPLLLSSGYEVHATSIEEPRETWPNVHWRQDNLLDPTQVVELVAQVQPSHLLHFAWYVTPGKWHTSLENYRWVQASLNLLQAFASHGGRRVVMAGTGAEYDWKYGYCSEALTPLLPATVYGACKHALQVMFEAFTGQTGLSGAWGRIFFLYGPHEHPARLVSSVIRSILQGEPALCSHGNQVRDYLYVRDVADAFVALLESDVVGPVNVASGNPLVLKDIIYKIAEKLERPDLVRLGALPSAADEPHLVVADVSRLRKVGWQPQYDLEQGLEQTINWWKNQQECDG